MVILKTKSKREPSKFIGAFLPQWVFAYFAIYTLAKGISKSELMRNLIEDWINKQKQQTDDKELIQEIIQNIKIQRELEKTTSPTTMIANYRTSVGIELKSRGINAEYITQILKEIE